MNLPPSRTQRRQQRAADHRLVKNADFRSRQLAFSDMMMGALHGFNKDPRLSFDDAASNTELFQSEYYRYLVSIGAIELATATDVAQEVINTIPEPQYATISSSSFVCEYCEVLQVDEYDELRATVSVDNSVIQQSASTTIQWTLVDQVVTTLPPELSECVLDNLQCRDKLLVMQRYPHMRLKGCGKPQLSLNVRLCTSIERAKYSRVPCTCGNLEDCFSELGQSVSDFDDCDFCSGRGLDNKFKAKYFEFQSDIGHKREDFCVCQTFAFRNPHILSDDAFLWHLIRVGSRPPSGSEALVCSYPYVLNG